MPYAEINSLMERVGGTGSILLIEDDDDVAEALADALAEQGYEVERSSDAEDALEVLGQGSAPDLILLDMMLPGMDGWEFRARQRCDARLAHIPVVVISADTSGKARAIDAEAYLRKPLNHAQLLDTIGLLVASQRKLHTDADALERERLSSLGSLSASIAHEINNPLQFVVGNLELARRKVAAVGYGLNAVERVQLEQADRLLEQAQRGTSRVADVVRSLAAFSRSNTAEMVAIDVREVLESVIQLLANEIRHRATLERDYGEIPQVTGNRARLGQALLNLLINATEAVGEVSANEHVIRVCTDTGPAGEAIIVISDTGRGMSPRMAAGIFNLFYATRNGSAGRTGGLAISQRIIRDMGGTIAVESAAGRGAVFRIELPGNAPVRESPPSSPVWSPISSMREVRRARILVVDDEVLICELVKSLLEDHYDVAALSRPLEALGRLLSGEKFDLVLCDLMMPELTGMDLHAEISRLRPEQAARMIFMTGGTFTEPSHRFLDTCGAPTLRKPFRHDLLMAVIAQRLAEFDDDEGSRASAP